LSAMTSAEMRCLGQSLDRSSDNQEVSWRRWVNSSDWISLDWNYTTHLDWKSEVECDLSSPLTWK
jgi:alkylated DNA nucleotide flippase Atl1